jgi:hypothetical protein
MHFTASIALAFSAFLSGGTLQSTETIVVQPFMPAQTVEEYVREYFVDIPVMAAIAKCESRFRQYDKNGSVLRGEIIYEDVGVMQVNETYHKAAAAELGLNLTVIQDNVAYARYLYDKKGTQPWNSSKACWGKTAEAKAHFALNK